MAILPKAISRFKATFTKIPMFPPNYYFFFFFFVKIEKPFLKLIRNHKGSPKRQNNLKGNKPRGLGLADIKTYYKFKQGGIDKDRHIDHGIG